MVWQDEARTFATRDLSGTDYVYLWVDGVHLKVRLEQEKLCLLVMIGVRTDGRKETRGARRRLSRIHRVLGGSAARLSLLEFYKYPAEHWIHLRTTNPIESTFATVRLRTNVTEGPGSRSAGLAMVYKLIEAAQTRWRAVNAPHLVALVRAGATFHKGKLLERPTEIIPTEPAGSAAREAA